ncbi:MAG: CotH kinase family protein, partial [Chthoniobacteraceae bacterium]
PLDEKPGFTLRFDKSDPERRFHGLKKIHLNNSVQDSSYVCEDLAGELFRRAGVPAPRTAWATLSLEGRSLGLYVLKEGFTREFLHQHFGNDDGNFYDSGRHHSDVIHHLELDSGDGAEDRADLEALACTADIADPALRWSTLNGLLDVERFISFMAMEVLAGHTDGYCLMQNNYRVYFESSSGRAVFLPHGTDRMFWETEAPIEPVMKGIVATAVMTTPLGAARYRQRLAELATEVFQPEWMLERARVVAELLEPVSDVAARDARLTGDRAAARAMFVREAIMTNVHADTDLAK